MLGFVEPLLFEQSTAEDDLRVADLVEEVRAPVEQLECVAGLLFGQAPVAGSEMNLCKRRDRLRRIRVAANLERNGERALEIRDRVVRLAEQEVQAAEVVEHSAEVLPVAVRLVELLRAFGERARARPRNRADGASSVNATPECVTGADRTECPSGRRGRAPRSTVSARC